MAPLTAVLCTAVVAAAAAAAAAAAVALPDGYVRVPSGRAVHTDCVYRLPEQGAHLSHEGRELVVRRGGSADGAELGRVPPCPHPVLGRGAASAASSSAAEGGSPAPLHGPAWKAWTVFDTNATGTVDALDSTWAVPGPPVNYQGEITYFWNGVEPEDMSAVLQPVLQYGSTPAGGGEFWAVASWYVSAEHGSVVSPLAKVPVGAAIVGSNVRDTNGSWAITATESSTGARAAIVYEPASTDYTRAYHVLEEYDIVTCQCYPAAGQVTFYNVSVVSGGAQVVPQWDCLTKNPTCGEYASVTSPSEVVIHTQPPAAVATA